MTLRGGKTRAGFTLVEMMVAFAIFMLIISAIYTTWSGIVRGSETGLKAAADTQRSRIAMKAIEEALLTAEMYAENVRYYSFVTDTTTDPNFATLMLTSRLPASFPGSGVFGDQVVRRVGFSVEPSTNGVGNVLVMRQTPYLVQDTDDPYPIYLARDVSLFVLEFWDTQMGDWATEFIVTNQFPKMVRVTLGLGHTARPDEPAEVVTRVVAIPASVITRDMQVPSRAASGPGGRGSSTNGPGQPPIRFPGQGGPGNQRGNQPGNSIFPNPPGRGGAPPGRLPGLPPAPMPRR